MTGASGPVVRVVAPSSALGRVELDLGLARMRAAGWRADADPRCRKVWMFYAGTDAERAQAFVDAAWDASVEVVWAARGGYGAQRLLPLLEKATAERGLPPRKLYVGYSDSTALFDFLRVRWGWAVVHGPMPALLDFGGQNTKEWAWLRGLVEQGVSTPIVAPARAMKFLGSAPAAPVRGRLSGGNLTVWASLSGTPFAAPRGQSEEILFWEDITESLSRIDRMVHQALQTGRLAATRALVLGEFVECHDGVPMVLAKAPSAGRKAVKAPAKKPLRPKVSDAKGIREIFGELGSRLGIPVALGFPSGHGARNLALPLGAQVELTPRGELRVAEWDWRPGPPVVRVAGGA
ncbi:MAG: LD-carboxypeptidase [Bdellovibrionales bacterium]|nr:LD-carboxypeptidase [Bdellovibrionales bacterium]